MKRLFEFCQTDLMLRIIDSALQLLLLLSMNKYI